MRARICAAGLLLWLGGSTDVLADHGKIDLVDLVNGDRLTCEIVELKLGKLSVKTDALGSVAIEWVKIQRLTSTVSYEVELDSGKRLLGSIASPSNGTLGIATAAGVVVVETSQVVRLQPLEAGFWKRLDGSIDVGFSYTQADQRIQWSADATVSRRTPKYLTQMSGDSLLTIDESSDRQSRADLTTSVQRLLSRRWFIFALSQLNQNEELGLRFRSVTGAGAGRYLKQSNRTELGVLAGATYTFERFVDEPVSNRPEAVQGIRWDWFTFGDRETSMSNSMQIYEGIGSTSRIRWEANSQIQVKLFKNFHLSLNGFESFDSAPPENQPKNDSSATISLGWSF